MALKLDLTIAKEVFTPEAAKRRGWSSETIDRVFGTQAEVGYDKAEVKALTTSAVERLLRGASAEVRKQAMQSYESDEVVPGRPFVPLKPMRPAKEGQRQVVDNLYEMVDFEAHPIWYSSTKRDGVRVVVSKNGDSVKIMSDDGADLTKNLPKSVEYLKSLPYKSFVLDCECERWQGENHLPREAATAAIHTGLEDDLIFNIFDVLFLEPIGNDQANQDD